MNDQPTDWQARAEKAEAELERLKAACAEMRKALSEAARELRFSPRYPRSEDQRERKRVIEQAQSALDDARAKGVIP